MEKYCEMLDYLGRVSLKDEPNNFANLFLFDVTIGKDTFEAILFAHALDSFVTVNEEIKNKYDIKEIGQIIFSQYKLETLAAYEN